MSKHAKQINRRIQEATDRNPTCETCDLAGQIEQCGPDLVKITEVPPSRHAWSDIAACPTEGCGRQFLVTRKSRP